MTGRNERCPCGSGKKFKKCCLNKAKPRVLEQAPPGLVEAGMRAMLPKMLAQQEWTARHGHIRPCIATNYHGYKFVAAGRKLYYGQNWKFVPDFLWDYIPSVFGKKWCEAEAVKPDHERHPLIQWHMEGRKYLYQQPRLPDGTFAAAMIGALAAYMTFSFNLFAIEDNSRFDDDLLARLKNKEQFQGARHEVFAEATCLRAGFSIEHENERDNTHRHAEFTAKHKTTGQFLSVEAKSKHREGVLGQPGIPQPHEKLSLRFGQLLNAAIAKNPPHPLVVFIDTNLPHRSAERVLGRHPLDPYKPSRIMTELLDRDRKTHGGVDRYAMLVFTNHPHHYAQAHELDPQDRKLAVIPNAPAGVVHLQALHDLHHAVDLYGNIPKDFPPQ